MTTTDSITATQPTLFSEESLAALSRKLHAWEEGPLAKTLQRQSERDRTTNHGWPPF